MLSRRWYRLWASVGLVGSVGDKGAERSALPDGPTGREVWVMLPRRRRTNVEACVRKVLKRDNRLPAGGVVVSPRLSVDVPVSGLAVPAGVSAPDRLVYSYAAALACMASLRVFDKARRWY